MYTFSQGLESIGDISEPSEHLNNNFIIFHQI